MEVRKAVHFRFSFKGSYFSNINNILELVMCYKKNWVKIEYFKSKFKFLIKHKIKLHFINFSKIDMNKTADSSEILRLRKELIHSRTQIADL